MDDPHLVDHSRTAAMTQNNHEQGSPPANAPASASANTSPLESARQGSTDLPPPDIPSGQDCVLLDPPSASTNGISVDVVYPTMSAVDTIALTFNGNNRFLPKPGSGGPDHKVTFLVPNEDIAKAVGKTIKVTYVVTRPTDYVNSQTLNVVVPPIPFIELTAPEIAQASAGELDVSALTADADLTLEPWPLIAKGQQLWLKLESSTSPSYEVWKNFPITDTGTQRTTITMEYLKHLTDGGELSLSPTVSFDEGLTQQRFPIRSYRIANSTPTEIIEDFAHYEPGNRTSPFTTEKNIVIENRGLSIMGQPGSCSLLLNAWPDKASTMTLNGTFTRVSIELSAIGGTVTLTCIYENGLREEVNVPTDSLLTYDFVHIGITSFELLGHTTPMITGLYILNIRLFT